MKDLLKHQYTTTKKLNIPSRPKVRMNCMDGMFFEILGNTTKQYKVKFIDKETDFIKFELVMQNNTWAKTTTKHYVDWRVEVTDLENSGVCTYDLNLYNNRVYIALDSKSLGDTLAWIPYVEEFKKKHKCEVVCSTFWNKLFEMEYPSITFVNPGEVVHNLTAMYKIGFFYNEDGTVNHSMNPLAPNTIPLQQVAADILGLDFIEIRPRITQPTIEINPKQITIAIHSTAQAKYWNNPDGWQTVVNWLNERGYTVKLLSSEPDGYMGNHNPIGVIQHPKGSIESVMNEIKHSKLFIGISSGLSWLSWALQTPVVMISGFTDTSNEMQDCIRINPKRGICSGCWSRHKFNPGDWNWCPDYKDTPRQFECSKTITPTQVIEELERIL